MTEWDTRPGAAPTHRQLAFWMVVGAAAVGGVVFASIRCAAPTDVARAYEARSLSPEPAPRLVATPEPSDDYYPCSDCHEDEPVDRTVRELEFEHDDLELEHGDLWCLHCHEAEDRDVLHLADDHTVPFEESWRLCTQCHGEKLADWRAGVHGKRMGSWWGPKTYEPCVTCHLPHAPHFEPLSPRPPPIDPKHIVWRAGTGATAEEDGR